MWYNNVTFYRWVRSKFTYSFECIDFDYDQYDHFSQCSKNWGDEKKEKLAVSTVECQNVHMSVFYLLPLYINCPRIEDCFLRPFANLLVASPWSKTNDWKNAISCGLVNRSPLMMIKVNSLRGDRCFSCIQDKAAGFIREGMIPFFANLLQLVSILRSCRS